MVDIEQIDIATTVTDSLIEVFETIFSMKLELSEDNSQSIVGEKRIVGSVCLAGRVLGCICVEVSQDFSDIMTAAMPDIKTEEAKRKEGVKDAMQEVCKVVGGNLKSAFCDEGLTCELSPPSFTTGDDFKIELLKAVTHERYVFSYNEHTVIVEVGIKVDDAEEPGDEALQSINERNHVDLTEVEAFDVKSPVKDQTIEVFDSMLSMALEASDEDLASAMDGDRVVGAVGFIGPLMGHFSIHVSREFSHQITATMLGIELEEVDGEDDVKDVMSDLCSTVAGNLKSKFCDSGMVCDISSPMLTTGANFKIKTQDMLRSDRCSFLHGEAPIVVELGLRVAEQERVEDPVETVPREDGNSDENMGDFSADEDLPEAEQTLLEEDFFEAEDQAADTDGFYPLDDEAKIDFILDIPLDIVVELGRNKMKINELYQMGPGSVVEFANLAGEPLDIIVNGTLIAKGEVMIQGEKYGIRIVDILSRMERIRSML